MDATTAFVVLTSPESQEECELTKVHGEMIVT
jgi:hypothetical protein